MSAPSRLVRDVVATGEGAARFNVLPCLARDTMAWGEGAAR